MSKTVNLILASVALSAVAGIPAWSAMHVPLAGEAVKPISALFDDGTAAHLLVLIDDDEDEDGGVKRGESANGDEDDCDEDEGSCGPTPAKAPAPAGSVAPPQNGLFGTGTPQVKVK